MTATVEWDNAPADDLDELADLFADLGGGDWQDRALCAQTDPEAFFPEKGGSTGEAKRICQGCEVRPECLEYALAHDERFGVWGGLSERERRKLKKRTTPVPITNPSQFGYRPPADDDGDQDADPLVEPEVTP